MSMLSVKGRKPAPALVIRSIRQVFEAAAQAVELPDHPGVAVAQLVPYPVLLRPVSAATGSRLLEQLAAARRALACKVLFCSSPLDTRA